MRFLVLRLDAPLMAFGDVAVDELRPTRLLPTQSQVTGLLANALGYRFTQGERLQRLQSRLIVGARLDRPGDSLRDYQTAMLDKKDQAWRTKHGPATRSGGDATYLGPTLRQRFYRADSVVTLVLALQPEDEQPTLDDVAQALAAPFRPLFLGRVCCPPAMPLYQGETVDAPHARAGLELAAPSIRAQGSEFLAEWPADGPGACPPNSDVPGEVAEIRDLRDWVNDLHAGSRLLARGMVSPLANRKTEVTA